MMRIQRGITSLAISASLDGLLTAQPIGVSAQDETGQYLVPADAKTSCTIGNFPDASGRKESK